MWNIFRVLFQFRKYAKWRSFYCDFLKFFFLRAKSAFISQNLIKSVGNVRVSEIRSSKATSHNGKIYDKARSSPNSNTYLTFAREITNFWNWYLKIGKNGLNSPWVENSLPWIIVGDKPAADKALDSNSPHSAPAKSPIDSLKEAYRSSWVIVILKRKNSGK